jgi:hypothetical protein
VKTELAGGTASAGSQAPHAQFKCEYCHRAEAGAASGDDAYVSLSYSAQPGTTGNLTLITTIAMFETGNFPKQIQYPATGTLTVDNWNTACGGATCVFALDGITPFVNKTDFLPDNLYPGNFNTINAQAGGRYNVSRMSETSTRQATGAPKDTNTTTQNNAFDPRKVTFSGPTGATVSLNGSGSSEVIPGSRYHAASLVSCMECHGGEQEKGVPGYEIESAEPYKHSNWLIDPTDPNSKCANCHYGSTGHLPGEAFLAAGGFQDASGKGLTTGSADEGIVEAHNEFVTGESAGVLRTASLGYGASNIACVGCHTHVAVDINFQKKYIVKFDANAMGTGDWAVGGYGADGAVAVHAFGNGSGETFATGDKTYTWAPGENLYINGTQQIVGLSNDTSDSQTALTTP